MGDSDEGSGTTASPASAALGSWRERAFSSDLWRHGDFLKLWAAGTASAFGSQVSLVALPLVAIYTLGASGGELGILRAAGAMPALLIGLFAGVWVDRVRRRPVLIVADVGRAILLGSIPLAALLGWLTMAQLYAVAFGVGALTICFDVAHMSFLPSLVRRDQLVEGNSKLYTSDSTASIGGPALGGLLVRLVTAPFAIVADALSFLISAALVGVIRVAESTPPGDAGRPPVRGEIREGLGWVLGQPLLRAMAASSGIFNLFVSFASLPLLVLYATRDLRISDVVLGLIIAASGPGWLLGSVVARPVGQRLGIGPTIVGSSLLTGIATMLIPLAAGPQVLAVVVLAVSRFLLGLGGMVISIHQLSLRQAITPDRLLGRMNASMRLIAWSVAPAGALLGGFLGDTIGMRPTFLLGAAGSLLAFVWLLVSPVRTLRDVPEPHETDDAPDEKHRV